MSEKDCILDEAIRRELQRLGEIFAKFIKGKHVHVNIFYKPEIKLIVIKWWKELRSITCPVFLWPLECPWPVVKKCSTSKAGMDAKKTRTRVTTQTINRTSP